MHVVPKAANDMMNVGRLQGFDVSSYSCSCVPKLHLLILKELRHISNCAALLVNLTTQNV